MANIKLTGGFSVCPEGEHIFRIYNVTYKSEFGIVEVFMVNAKGITHKERFTLLGNDNQPNEAACNAFSIFAKNALNNFSLEEIDHTELIDRYIKCEIIHTQSPSTKDPSKMVTFANSGKKYPAEGFDTEAVPKALTLGKENTSAKVEKTDKGIDLDSVLN